MTKLGTHIRYLKCSAVITVIMVVLAELVTLVFYGIGIILCPQDPSLVIKDMATAGVISGCILAPFVTLWWIMDL